MKIVVGLGNPGKRYAFTRHNLGFMVADKLAELHGLTFSRQKFKSKIASGLVAGQQVLLAKPQTFMNLSGDSVGPLVRFYGLELADLLVVYDDADLPFGKIRLRPSGASGGHKGMESIISNLGTNKFPRLRVGIRGETVQGELSDYVLGRFTTEEGIELDAIVKKACEAIETALENSFEMAMSRFNQGG